MKVNRENIQALTASIGAAAQVLDRYRAFGLWGDTVMSNQPTCTRCGSGTHDAAHCPSDLRPRKRHRRRARRLTPEQERNVRRLIAQALEVRR